MAAATSNNRIAQPVRFGYLVPYSVTALGSIAKEQAMFEGLDDICWSEMHSCYEDGTKIPEQIRALLDEDAGRREAAVGYLFNNLLHQGTVYETTAAAVPFLIQVLEHPSCKVKSDLLRLLAVIAQENSPLYQEKAFEPDDAPSSVYRWDLYKTIPQAISAGLPIYLELLYNPDPKIRANATYTIARFPDCSRETISVLSEALLEEVDERVQASLVLCLACIWPSEQPLDFFERWLEPPTSLNVQVCAALGVARIVKQGASERVVALLCQGVKQLEQVTAFYATLPWCYLTLTTHLCHFLCLVGSHKASWTMPFLFERLVALVPDRWPTSIEATQLMLTILILEFPKQDAYGDVAVLSPRQRATLERLASYPYRWNAWTVQEAFRERGLPETREGLMQFLGMEAQQPL